MKYIWLIPLLPGLGALVNGVVGIRAFSRKASGLLACATMTVALGLSLAAFWQLLALRSGFRKSPSRRATDSPPSRCRGASGSIRCPE